MSLSALPTELDEQLLAFLHYDGLSCVTRVSRYWQALAEPHLYHNVYFTTIESRRVHCLVLALLSRSYLGTYIRSVN